MANTRSVSWRRLCGDVVGNRIDEALDCTIFILQQTGPTGFILKQDRMNKRHKVLLGDPHSCTCSTFKKEKELCIHILWVLLRKFRMKKDNKLVYQLGLVEREINEVVKGPQPIAITVPQSQSTDERTLDASISCDQRPVAVDDTCPICQDKLLKKPQRLSFCKYGCGKSVHLKCIKHWSDFQKQQGEKTVNCPLCREEFCTYQELSEEYHGKMKRRNSSHESFHYGTSCSQCHINPVVGKCYRCTICPRVFLCHQCFVSNNHPNHSFQYRHHPSRDWKPAIRPTIPVPIDESAITDIQNRELTEDDYDLLLKLDQPAQPAVLPIFSSPTVDALTSTMMPDHILHSFPTEPLDHSNPLLLSKASCQLCYNSFRRGDWVKRLPCKHKHRFHRDCVDHWLTTGGHNTCPIDNQIVYDKKIRQRPKTSVKVTRLGSHSINSDRQILGMSVSGHQISQMEQEQDGASTIRAPLPSVAMAKKVSIQRGLVYHPAEYTRRVAAQLPSYFSLNAVSLSSGSISMHGSESNSPVISATSRSRADPSNSNGRRRQQRRGSLGTPRTVQEALPRINPTKSRIRDMRLALQVSSLSKPHNEVLPSITVSNTNQ